MIENSEVRVEWNGVATGAWYRLDYTPTLDPTDWQPAGPLIQASSSTIEMTDTNSVDAVQRFFRLYRWFQ